MAKPHALARGAGMPYFHKEHWEKDEGEIELSNLKYTSGEMENPEHLKKSVKMQSEYAKKHEMKYP